MEPELTSAHLIPLLQTKLLKLDFEISDVARAIRLANGMTISEFASSCDLSEVIINQIENGKANPTLKTLQVIASKAGLQVQLVPKVSSARVGANALMVEIPELLRVRSALMSKRREKIKAARNKTAKKAEDAKDKSS